MTLSVRSRGTRSINPVISALVEKIVYSKGLANKLKDSLTKRMSYVLNDTAFVLRKNGDF